MLEVTKAEYLEGYKIRVSFNTGETGTVDLKDALWGPVFEPLKDETLFSQVTIDEFGAICWPNGADLAPDALHARLSDRAWNGVGPGRGAVPAVAGAAH